MHAKKIKGPVDTIPSHILCTSPSIKNYGKNDEEEKHHNFNKSKLFTPVYRVSDTFKTLSYFKGIRIAT